MSKTFDEAWKEAWERFTQGSKDGYDSPASKFWRGYLAALEDIHKGEITLEQDD